MTDPDALAALKQARSSLRVIANVRDEAAQIAAAVLLASVEATILDGVIDRLENPVPPNQARDVSRRPGFKE